MKNKPFLSRRVSLIYIATVILVQPYWVTEIVANFLYFNPPYNDLFKYTRPYEALFRDPWWIFTCCSLFWNIKRRYEFGIIELCRVSPRFAVLLVSMTLSVGFIIVDILSVTHVIDGSGAPDGINPFWKLSFVFKCLTDTIILDDFKTALDRLKQYRMRRLSTFGAEMGQPGSSDDRRCSEMMPIQKFHSPDWSRREKKKPKDWAELSDCVENVDLEMQRPEPTKLRTPPVQWPLGH